MRIRVVGAGWYGSHIALALLREGHDVVVYERHEQAFAGASGHNQSRLHRGFHYPRCFWTRSRALTDYDEFMRHYGHLTNPVRTNIYAVAKNVSMIDWMTYKLTMHSTGIDFLEVGPEDYGLANCEGAMLTGERLIVQDRARDWFTDKLGAALHLDHEVETIRDPGYDVTIDCTFGMFGTHPVEWVEPCVMLIFSGPTDRAVTIMDGPEGVSLYPFDEQHVSLTSVSETPFARCETMADAYRAIGTLTPQKIDQIKKRMIARLDAFWPSFADAYRFHSHVTAPRVKPISASDRRACVVTPNDDVITVFPGKISGVFEAERRVLDILDGHVGGRTGSDVA